MCKTPVLLATRAIFVTFKVALVLGALWFTVACTTGGDARSSAASQEGRHAPFKEWQVIDTATGQLVYEERLNLGGSIYPSISVAGKYLFVSSDNGTIASASLGLCSDSPSIAPSTETAGVITPSP